MEDIMEIVKSLEELDLIIKYAIKTIENEAKKQSKGFADTLLGIHGASLLGNVLASKRMRAPTQGQEVLRAGEGTMRAEQDL